MRVLCGENNTGFASKLTSLMSSGFSKRTKTRIRIETDEVNPSILDNSEVWFQEATSLDTTREWIEGVVGGEGLQFMFYGKTSSKEALATFERSVVLGRLSAINLIIFSSILDRLTT
jgi:hypothetical protein